jgi:allantoinase
MNGPVRDLVGYADQRPKQPWKGGARLALSLVINYEEGAEPTPLLGDPAAETVNSEVLRGPAIPGLRNLSMESFYEYGSRLGFWRVLDLFAERRVAYTVYAVGYALTLNTRVCEVLRARKPDIVGHGWRWIDYGEVPEAIEREHIAKTLDTIEALTGVRPVGWYTGRPSPNSRRLLAERGDILFDSDAFNDDIPYWTRAADRFHLVVPYANDTNDNRFARGEGIEIADEYFSYLRDTFDWLYNRSPEPAMMSVGLHARLIGRPGRLCALERFLDHVAKHKEVWIAARTDIARHWAETYPPPYLPSRLLV